MPASVLLVDDEPAVLRVLGMTLDRAGFAPQLAESGEQALALLAQRQFDAALVDKNLVGMDGIDLLSHVRKRQPRCACIVMTAYPSTSSAVAALRLGVLDYLEKPSPELDLVAERVQSAIRQARLQEERDGLTRSVALLQTQLKAKDELIAQLSIEMAMTGELIDVRVAEAANGLRDQLRARDQQLIASARELVALAGRLRGSQALVAAIEAHVQALEA